MPAHRGKSSRGAAVELQLRRTTVAHDLDVAPEHLLGVARAQCLHACFLRGKPAGEMNRGLAAAGAVRNFAGGENALQEPLAVPLDGRRDTRNFGRVKPEADDVGRHIAKLIIARHKKPTGSLPRRDKRRDKRYEMILPTPNEAFEWTRTAAGPALICRPLAGLAPHMFTTLPWPLGSRTSDPDDAAVWGDVARAMRVDRTELARVRQVHGASVAVAENVPGRRPEADIIVANSPKLALAVQVADCVPLLIADSRTGAVAAAHAGWRGMAAHVPAAVVEALTREFGTRPADLMAAVGPAIGACCYEVGPDVRAQVEAADGSGDQMARWFLTGPVSSTKNPPFAGLRDLRREHHWFFDIWSAARDQLEAAGVPTDRIFVAELCTASHPDVLCSYRRDGASAGRMAAAIRSAPPRP